MRVTLADFEKRRPMKEFYWLIGEFELFLLRLGKEKILFPFVRDIISIQYGNFVSDTNKMRIFLGGLAGLGESEDNSITLEYEGNMTRELSYLVLRMFDVMHIMF